MKLYQVKFTYENLPYLTICEVSNVQCQMTGHFYDPGYDISALLYQDGTILWFIIWQFNS